ncbi:MAG: DUF4157 domain-containing protein [Saprospiraceae bacterium]|nr:DUF4157 domain-containing protein [Saprospiraceae bacterium]
MANHEDNSPSRKDKEGKVYEQDHDQEGAVSVNHDEDLDFDIDSNVNLGGINSKGDSMAIGNSESSEKLAEEESPINEEEEAANRESEQENKEVDTSSSGGGPVAPKPSPENIQDNEGGSGEEEQFTEEESDDDDPGEEFTEEESDDEGPVEGSEDENLDTGTSDDDGASGGSDGDRNDPEDTTAKEDSDSEENKSEKKAEITLSRAQKLVIKFATLENKAVSETLEDEVVESITDKDKDNSKSEEDVTTNEDKEDVEINKDDSSVGKTRAAKEDKKETKPDKDVEELMDQRLENQLEEKKAVESEAIKKGTLVGRASGYGQMLKIIDTSKPEDPKQQKSEDSEVEGGTQSGDTSSEPKQGNCVIEKVPFYPAEKLEAERKEKNIGPNTYEYKKLKESKETPPKKQYIKEEADKAKAEDQSRPQYLKFYYQGYNIGYSEGLRFQKEDEKKKREEAEKEREKDPNYKLGKDLGTYAGMIAIQQQGNKNKEEKKGNDFELKASNGKEYKTSFKIVHSNASSGKNPDGQPMPENFKKAYLKFYNINYLKSQSKKEKGPSHQERLEDPLFKQGYLDGNKLGRNDNLKAEELERLKKVKKEHFSSSSVDKAKKDKNKYGKIRAGFIYGYNQAFYQKKAEKAAEEKALQERKKNDPVYQLGETAGSIKGLLASVFTFKRVKSVVSDPEAIKKAGISIVVPPNIVKIIKLDNYPTSEPLYANPDSTKDKEEKVQLIAKRNEQIGFFKQAYKLSTDASYIKTEDNKAEFSLNKKKETAGYKKALRTVYRHEERIDENDDEPVSVKLNLGELVAYAKFKCKYLADDDPHKSQLQTQIQNAENLYKNEDVDFQAAYRKSYNIYSVFLLDPTNKIAGKIKGKFGRDTFSGKNDNEKFAFNLGKSVGGFKIEKDEKLEDYKKEGLDTKLYEKKIRLMVKAITLDAKIALVNEFDPDLKISASTDDELQSELDTVLGDTPDNKVILSNIRSCFRVFYNGYRDVLSKEIQKKKQKGKKGNKKIDLDIATKDAVSFFSGKVKEKAKNLFIAGAQEGYNLTYNQIKEEVHSKRSANTFDEPDLNQKITNKLDKKKDTRGKEIDNNKELRSEKDQLISIYMEGFNIDLKQKKQFGYYKGYEDGRYYEAGFKNDKSEIDKKYKENKEHPAYKEGAAKSASETGYGAFASMMTNTKEKIKEKEAMYGNIKSNLARSAFEEGNEKDIAAWTKMFLLKNSQIVPDDVEKNVESIKGPDKEEIEISETTLLEFGSKNDKIIQRVLLWYKEVKSRELAVAVREKYKDVRVESEGETEEGDDSDVILIKIGDNETKKIVVSDEVKKDLPELEEGFKKGYAKRVEAIEKEILKSKDENILYVIGYRDGYIRIAGSDKLPENLKVAQGKLEEALKNKDINSEDYKSEAKYIEGDTKGSELAMQIKSGMITNEQAGNIVNEQNKGNVQSEFSAGQAEGVKLGQLHAKEENHAQMQPNALKSAEDLRGVISKEIKEAKQKLKQAEKESKENESDEDSKNKVKDAKSNLKRLKIKKSLIDFNPSKLFKDGFVDAYWKARDKEAGKIEGIKAVLSGEADMNVKSFYTVIVNDTDIPDKEKRAVKNAKIFEDAFLLSLENARKSSDPQKLHDETTTIKRDPKLENKDQRKARILKKAFLDAENIALKIGQRHGAYRAADELGILEKLSKSLNTFKLEKELLEYRMGALEQKLDNRSLIAQAGVLDQIHSEYQLYAKQMQEYPKLEAKCSKIIEIFTEEDGIILSVDKGLAEADSYLPENGGTFKLDVLLGLKNETDTDKDNDQSTKGDEKLSDDDKVKQSLTLADKKIVYDKYTQKYNQNKEVAYSNYLIEFTNNYASKGDLGLGEVDNFMHEKSGNETGKAGEIADEIKDIVLEGEESDDVIFSNLPLVSILYEQEEIINTAHENIADELTYISEDNVEIADLENKRMNLEDKFGFTEAELKLEIDQLKEKENEEPLSFSEKRELKKYTKQYNKIKKVSDEIADIEGLSTGSKDSIDKESDSVMDFFSSQLGITVAEDYKWEVKEYLEYKDFDLFIDVAHAYSSENLKFSGSGQYEVFENAQDIEVTGSINLSKDDYTFSSSGFRYIRDDAHITLMNGNAIIPRLEGDASANEMGEYKFDDIGLDLSTGVRGQVKIQSEKLVGGPVLESSGTRTNTIDQAAAEEFDSSGNDEPTQLKDKSDNSRGIGSFGKSSGSGIPSDMKAGFEQYSGMSMDDVKVHKNSNKPAQLNAHAYAKGNEVHLAPGQEKHLPHELGHIIQQKKGQVKATKTQNGSQINDDPKLEKGADNIAAKVNSLKLNPDTNTQDINTNNGGGNNEGLVQNKTKTGTIQENVDNNVEKPSQVVQQKAHVDSNIIQCALTVDRVSYNTLEEIKELMGDDWDDKWTSIVQDILQMNDSNNFFEFLNHASLAALKKKLDDELKTDTLEKANRLFVEHKKGVCYFENLMGGDGVIEPLTRMFTPEGEEIFVNQENMAEGMKDFQWTTNPPRKKKALYAPAKPCELSQGLSQMFTCHQCGEMSDAADDCDWVVHDKEAGGCGAANIISNGDAHSRNNEAFRSAMKGLTSESTKSQIIQTIKAHEKAASFWGFQEVESILKEEGAWGKIKVKVLYIHSDLSGFAAAMDKLAP